MWTLASFVIEVDARAREQRLASGVATDAVSPSGWSVRSWRRYLKPGGVLAVSELTWLTHRRPAELGDHWASEYPEVATASAKLALLEASGYTPIGYFPLPTTCWLDHYYGPMQRRFAAFLDRHDHSAAAKEIVRAEQHEIDLYERFSAFVSYGFYVATRTTD